MGLMMTDHHHFLRWEENMNQKTGSQGKQKTKKTKKG